MRPNIKKRIMMIGVLVACLGVCVEVKAASPELPKPFEHKIEAMLEFPEGFKTDKEGHFKVVAYLKALEQIETLSFELEASPNLRMDFHLPQFVGGLYKGQKYNIQLSGQMKNVEDLFESLQLNIIYRYEEQTRRMTKILSIQADWPKTRRE